MSVERFALKKREKPRYHNSPDALRRAGFDFSSTVEGHLILHKGKDQIFFDPKTGHWASCEGFNGRGLTQLQTFMGSTEPSIPEWEIRLFQYLFAKAYGEPLH